MINFLTLQRELLSKFHFSIVGYPDLESRINDLLTDFFTHNDIWDSNKIDFISYSLVKLDYEKISDYDDYTRWPTRSLKDSNDSVYFISKNPILDEHLLSIYYTLRFVLFPETKNDDKVAKKLSALLNDDLNYRICIGDKEKAKLSYDQGEKLLSIHFPISIFNPTYIQSKDNCLNSALIDETIFKSLQNIKKNIIRDSTNKGVYKKDRSDKSIPFKELIEKLFDKENVNTVKESLLLQFLLIDELEQKLFQHDKYLFKKLEDFIELSFPVAFISAYFRCKTEYFPSIAGVFKDGEEKRNLGALIVGYSQIFSEDRGLLKILSEFISTRLAAQFLHEKEERNKYLNFRIQQIAILERFHKKCLKLEREDENEKESDDDISHGGTVKDKHIQALNSFIAENKSNFSHYGLNFFKERILSHFKRDSYVDVDLFVSCYHEIRPELKKCCNFNNNTTTTLSLSIGKQDRPYLNISLVHYFIKELLQRNISKKNKDLEVSIITLTKENKAIIHATYSNSFSFISLINGLQSSRPGKLATFIQQHFNDFRIAGNLLIYDKDDFVNNKGNIQSIINLEKDFKAKSDGSLMFIGVNPKKTETNGVTFIIEFYSI